MPNLSILVVDDDDDVRTMIRVLLSGEGYAVEDAADGLEALRHLRSHPPDLVLLDLMMPRMSGEDLMSAMAADESLADIPVAILSGQTRGAPMTSGPHVVAYLTKPVELDVLLAVVDRFAGHPA
jgi:two-component system, chemotaxis family, chemotaxis protein CheY